MPSKRGRENHKLATAAAASENPLGSQALTSVTQPVSSPSNKTSASPAEKDGSPAINGGSPARMSKTSRKAASPAISSTTAPNGSTETSSHSGSINDVSLTQPH